jgi:hypothetical protein
MNDLNSLLDRAAGPAPASVDPHADLTRGHEALARTRRRRTAAGLLGVATAGLVGIGVARQVTTDQGPVPAIGVDHGDRSGRTGVVLLAQPFEAGPYTFDATPEGWEVQGAVPSGVTIAPVGFPDQEPLSFVGKLVILFDGNPLGRGERVELDGRAFMLREGEGYTTISTPTRPGEPAGVVRIQYPSDTGWTRATMLEFLAGVHVGPSAQPGLG